jgi:pimeloyl-ACP methyl ester carboxylesterase/DNA-binding CsgD family transcriptional regulator
LLPKPTVEKRRAATGLSAWGMCYSHEVKTPWAVGVPEQWACSMKQQIQFCTTQDGVRLALAKAGEGPPLVRTANWFTHLELDWDSAIWRHWFEALADGRTLVRYDPRGSGLSDRNVDDFSLEAWIRDLEAVVDAAGLQRFPLIGLCQGGVVAVAFAARHPQRVSRLILYDSYLSGAYAEGVDERMQKQAQTLSEMIELGWGREAGAFREVFANLLMPDATKEQLRWIGELQRRSASAPTAKRLWDAFNTFDIRAEAKKLRVPTLVFHVRGDAMVPFEAGRRLAAAIPNARFVPLEGKNHILLANEKAWQTFRAELANFLAADEPTEFLSRSKLEALSAREKEILDYIARGLANVEIARMTGIAEKTVRNHITTIFSKLAVEHRAQAIVVARKAGLGRD